MAKKGLRLKSSDLSLFASQISLFLRSGLSLSEGLVLMEDDMGDKNFRAAVSAVRQSVDDRMPLHEAMEQVGCFPPYMVQMASIGEVSGHLEGMMDALTRYYEREAGLKQRIKSAVTYPLLLIVMMTAVVFLLIVRVLPMFSNLLASLGQVELPGLVAGLLAFGDFITVYWWAVLGGLIVVVGGFLLFRRTAFGTAFMDRFKANSFVTRGVYRKIAAERFSTAMSYLISSNVDVEMSLDLTKEILGNAYMSGRITQCRKLMEDGTTLYDALYEVGIFPKQFSRMLAIGFKSGELDSMMNHLSSLYEQEVDSSLRRITGSIEPIFVSILSILVGVIMVSVMLPLIDIMSMIG